MRSVIREAVANGDYVVIQAVNSMTYTGKAVSYDDEANILTVHYEKDNRGFETDIMLDNVCSVQLTTKEEIEKVRETKRERRERRK